MEIGCKLARNGSNCLGIGLMGKEFARKWAGIWYNWHDLETYTSLKLDKYRIKPIDPTYRPKSIGHYNCQGS